MPTRAWTKGSPTRAVTRRRGWRAHVALGRTGRAVRLFAKHSRPHVECERAYCRRKEASRLTACSLQPAVRPRPALSRAVPAHAPAFDAEPQPGGGKDALNARFARSRRTALSATTPTVQRNFESHIYRGHVSRLEARVPDSPPLNDGRRLAHANILAARWVR